MAPCVLSQLIVLKHVETAEGDIGEADANAIRRVGRKSGEGKFLDLGIADAGKCYAVEMPVERLCVGQSLEADVAHFEIADIETVERIGAHAGHEPHRVAFYLHDLAALFHSHWNRGKDQPQLRFLNEKERDLSNARLALVCSLTSVLASGLNVLGVNAPDEMR